MARINTFSRYLLVVSVMIFALSGLALAADDGYPGLIAPSHDDNSAPNTPPAAQATGTPAPTADQSATPAQSTIPYSTPVIDDLGRASAIYGAQQTLTPPIADYSNVHHSKINGKPLAVYVVELRIKQAMAPVNDTSLSDDDHTKAAKAAFKSLSTLADMLQKKLMIPDSIYKSMKLSDQYIQDERDGNNQALTELDTALDQLKPMQ